MIKVTDKYVFFYKEWPSNFKRTKFTYNFKDGERPEEFFCTEQAFMYCKARFFNDGYMARRILESNTPMHAKELGREVSGYVDSEWDKVRYSYMRDVNLERFKQDEDLNKMLLSPEFDGKIFVEASPVDLIWGIGVGMDDPDLTNDRLWKGRNLLGKALTEVRDALKEKK